MKKHCQLMVALMLPVTAIAQPVINSAENYTTGTVIRRLVCDPVASEPGGTAQTWNFNNLTLTGDTMVFYNIAPISGNPFTGANIAQYAPNDSVYSHYQKNSTETLMVGTLDSSSNDATAIYNNSMLMMRRPFTYADTAADSFAFETNFSGFPTYATGGLTIEADGYGTLYLPNDTFTNVLRVRIESHEQDSIDGVGNLFLDNVYYVWYSNLHNSPVLRVDSINISGLASLSVVDVQYLHMEASTTGISTLPSAKTNVIANLTDKSLLLKGDFHQGRNYELALFSINGSKIYSTNFAATGNEQKFDINNALATGTYILTLRMKGDMSSFQTIKLVKQ